MYHTFTFHLLSNQKLLFANQDNKLLSRQIATKIDISMRYGKAHTSHSQTINQYLQIYRSSMTENRQQNKRKIHQILLSMTPLRNCSPSADMLLRTRDLGISIRGGGLGEKHTTTTVRLSQVFLLRASRTSSREHRSGSL